MVLNYLQLIRIPALFTAFSNICAANLIVSEGVPQWGDLFFLLLASGCIYCAGMVLNDCFDVEEDRRSRPGRPLASGKIELKKAWSLGWLLLVAGVIISLFVSWTSFWIAFSLAVFVVLYNAVAKHGRLGPFVMGGCRYLNWLLGLSVFPLSSLLFLLPIPVFCYITSLTLLSRVETEEEDHNAIIYCGTGMIVASLSFLLLFSTGLLTQYWPIALVAAGLFLVLGRLSRLAKDFAPGSAQSMVRFLLLGIIPLDALLVFSAGPWWGGFVILLLIIPSRMLARVMYMT